MAAQDRLVLARMKIQAKKKGREKRQKKITWWRMKEPEAKRQFKEKVLENWVEADSVQEWWMENSRVMRRAAGEVLGKTSGKKAPANKET